MLTLPIKRLIEWLHNGNNCEKCACSWAEQGYDDWDCGCNIKGADYDEKRCYLVLPIRWLLLRRAKYYADHQYDGIEEWYKKKYKQEQVCKAAILEAIGVFQLYWEDKNGEAHKMDVDSWADYNAWKVFEACQPEYAPPPRICQRWKSLLYDTVMIAPNAIKPFILK